MLYFANPCGPAVIAAMQAGTIAYIDTPAQGNKRPEGVTWCADNGAFSDRFNEPKWWAFLEANAYAAETCLFAVAPDVVGDAAATIKRSAPWLPKIRALGYPVAFVAQDGLGIHWNGTLHAGDLNGPIVRWDSFDVLFIGGTTDWKLGAPARALVVEAKRRGKWVHMGRVNSERRFEYARAIGCDSVDGTYLTFGPNENLPTLLAWTRNEGQSALFGATP